jgi:hypothetical protein
VSQSECSTLSLLVWRSGITNCMIICCQVTWQVVHTAPLCILISLLTYLLTPWSYISFRTLAASHTLCEVSWQQPFTGWSRQPHVQSPTWRTRVYLLVWHIPRNLSGMGGPTSSYAAVGISFRAYWCTQAPHPATKCFRQGENCTISLLPVA